MAPAGGRNSIVASPPPDLHDVAELLDVPIQPGGKIIAISDLHLPPERTTPMPATL